MSTIATTLLSFVIVIAVLKVAAHVNNKMTEKLVHGALQVLATAIIYPLVGVRPKILTYFYKVIVYAPEYVSDDKYFAACVAGFVVAMRGYTSDRKEALKLLRRVKKRYGYKRSRSRV